MIPNPISFTNNHILAELEEKKAITIGRLSYPKNYKSLINVWKIVTDKHSDWLLEIWGAGEEYKTLNQRIISLGLQNNIFLKGYTNDVSLKLAESSLLYCLPYSKVLGWLSSKPCLVEFLSSHTLAPADRRTS